MGQWQGKGIPLFAGLFYWIFSETFRIEKKEQPFSVFFVSSASLVKDSDEVVSRPANSIADNLWDQARMVCLSSLPGFFCFIRCHLNNAPDVLGKGGDQTDGRDKKRFVIS
ncbi:MAG: hypothetical protein E3K36_11120 [Candidatus Brocadia sp.]|nr:hypothetical protein [Candidatus Brocadia sp.]